MTEDVRYPIGKFERPGSVSEAQRSEWIRDLAEVPANVRRAVTGLSDAQLDTPYREGGWTVRQVAHHIADASANHYVRFKLALTEDRPTIKPFEEVGWSELADAKAAPVDESLAVLEGLHRRLDKLLRSLGPADFARTFVHPASGSWTLDQALGLFVWHSRHHTAHIESLRRRMGWH